MISSVTSTRPPLVSMSKISASAFASCAAFTASGTVTAVNVKAGDKVTAGQVLATVDSAELQSAVTSAERTRKAVWERLGADAEPVPLANPFTMSVLVAL